MIPQVGKSMHQCALLREPQQPTTAALPSCFLGARLVFLFSILLVWSRPSKSPFHCVLTNRLCLFSFCILYNGLNYPLAPQLRTSNQMYWGQIGFSHHTDCTSCKQGTSHYSSCALQIYTKGLVLLLQKPLRPCIDCHKFLSQFSNIVMQSVSVSKRPMQIQTFYKAHADKISPGWYRLSRELCAVWPL